MMSEQISAVRNRIKKACETADAQSMGVAKNNVRLLAVSKTFPANRVREAFEAGLSEFGENYVQEGIEKIAALSDIRHNITWHFIGPLQSNKTRDVAEHFDWMHTVDRDKIAKRLSEQRPKGLAPLQVCVQVNVSGEASKSGVTPKEAASLVQMISAYPGIRVRGLMAIPEPTDDVSEQRHAFGNLRRLASQIRATLGPHQAKDFDTLSMGMSADLESAVAESSGEFITMVRVGSAIFGARPPKN